MNKRNLFRFLVFLFLITGSGANIFAHPMPNSIVILKIHEKNISGEIQLPLGELQSAIGMNVNDNSVRLLERLGDTLQIYLLNHIRPKTLDGKPWQVKLGEMEVVETKSQLSGEYKELLVAFSITPPLHYDLRNFYFDYDVILHQVASHKALITIKQDWQQGIFHEDSTTQEVGVIEWDVVNNQLKPFQISLEQGSNWKGFKSMFFLGTKHIAEGTDHLLFLLVLLLPIPLLINNKKWANHRSVKQSLINILKIVTAFTIGHSITLLFGALGWVTLPSKPIEIIIGISILVSAFHAIKPIFAKKEIYIALGFGLIHGLAFAYTLADLSLSSSKMVLSILGFNLGIEVMQMLVIIAVIPWLILLSRTSIYTIFRVLCAFLAIIAASAWILERISEKQNVVTESINTITSQNWWIYVVFIAFSMIIYYFEKSKKQEIIS